MTKTILKNKHCIRVFITICIIVTVLTYIQTELLSVVGALNRVTVVIFWGLILIAAVAGLTGSIVKKKIDISLTRDHYIVMAVFALIYVWMISLAIRTPSYNWDSMTYHLARVHEWFVNGSIGHFATNNIRQLVSPPLGEILVLQLYALCGGADIAVNLVQCMGYIGTGIVIYGILRRLKVNILMSGLGGLIFYATPICFGEALTTQVDNVAAFWLVSFVYLMMEFLDKDVKLVFDKKGIINALTMSLCVAFAYLTKPSVCVAILVWSIALLVLIIVRKDSPIVVGKYAIMSFGVAGVTVAPELIRNKLTFGSISSDIAGARQLIGTLKPNYILINLIKNGVWNLPLAKCDWLNAILDRGVKGLAYRMGVYLDDVTISEDGGYYYLLSPNTWNHDQALNPLVVYALIILVPIFIAVLVFAGKKIELSRKIYIICSLTSFTAFLAVLRWEPFINRYLVGYFALLAVTIVVILASVSDCIGHGKIITILASCLICAICLGQFIWLSAMHNSIATSYTDREQGYYVNNLPDTYMPVVKYCKDAGYAKIGIKSGGNTYTYPICHELYLNGQKTEYVLVDNESSKYEKLSEDIDAIVLMDVECQPVIYYNDMVYEKVMETEANDRFCVYERQ